MLSNNPIEIDLPYKPPLHWPYLLTFFRYHQIADLEIISDTFYQRTFKINNAYGWFRVLHHATQPQLKLTICVNDQTVIPIIVTRARRMFDLDVNLDALAHKFSQHKLFSMLWQSYPGLRIASSWDPFEAVINTILGQLVSVKQARNLMKQLADSYGEPVTDPIHGTTVRLFPEPRILASANLNTLGTTQVKKRTIQHVSKLINDQHIDLAILKDDTPHTDMLKQKLLNITGIGPWSVEYIMLRALGHHDAFPKTDLILKRAIQKYQIVDIEQFQPWRAYVALYLWKHYIESQPAIDNKDG